MIYCFDIDGTLCTNTNGQYDQAKPFSEIIEIINALHEEGNIILLYTARGSTTGVDWKKKTKNQLREWGVRYHQLFFGKPTADIYIDDKSENVKSWKRRELRRWMK